MVDDGFNKEVNLSVIGGGEVGTSLLKIFLKMEAVKIKHMVDLDPEAQGMQLAKENNISNTSDLMTEIENLTTDLI